MKVPAIRIVQIVSLALLVPVIMAGSGSSFAIHTCNMRGTVAVLTGLDNEDSCHKNCCSMDPVSGSERPSIGVNSTCCSTNITDLSPDRITPPFKKTVHDQHAGLITGKIILDFRSESPPSGFSTQWREKYGGRSLTILQHRLII